MRRGADWPGAAPRGADDGAWVRELDLLRGELANLRLQLQYSQCLPAPGEDPAAADRRPQTLHQLADRLVSGVVTGTIEIRDGVCTTVAVVGPTGVGKTTTIAKLAAAATRVEGRRVAFITIDTYRIGAVEQLDTYAKLLNVPLSVVRSPDDMRAARERYAGYDLIFLDTVGRPAMRASSKNWPICWRSPSPMRSIWCWKPEAATRAIAARSAASAGCIRPTYC
jgi:SRP54 family protein